MYLAWLKTGRPWLSAPVYEAHELLRATGPLAGLQAPDVRLGLAGALGRLPQPGPAELAGPEGLTGLDALPAGGAGPG